MSFETANLCSLAVQNATEVSRFRVLTVPTQAIRSKWTRKNRRGTLSYIDTTGEGSRKSRSRIPSKIGVLSPLFSTFV